MSAIDPRADNCKQHRIDSNGKVTGIHLSYFPVPGSKYALRSVRLLDEYEAAGQTIATVAVVDQNGIPTSAPVALAWPFNGDLRYEHYLYPGNAKLPAEHVISNGFNPPNLGPLMIFVGGNGQMESDVIASLGLPYNRHVSFHIVYQRRVTGPTPPPTPPPGEGGILERLQRIESKLDKLSWLGRDT